MTHVKITFLFLRSILLLYSTYRKICLCTGLLCSRCLLRLQVAFFAPFAITVFIRNITICYNYKGPFIWSGIWWNVVLVSRVTPVGHLAFTEHLFEKRLSPLTEGLAWKQVETPLRVPPPPLTVTLHGNRSQHCDFSWKLFAFIFKEMYERFFRPGWRTFHQEQLFFQKVWDVLIQQ